MLSCFYAFIFDSPSRHQDTDDAAVLGFLIDTPVVILGIYGFLDVIFFSALCPRQVSAVLVRCRCCGLAKHAS